MTSRHPEPGHDEYETMPWAMLAGEIDKGKHRTMALTVVAAVAVGILAFLVVRSFRQPPGTVVDVAPPAAATASEPPPVEPVVATTMAVAAVPPVEATLPPAEPTDPVVYSEEDLMAGVPDVDMRLAVARAEWFVTDYFSSGPVGEGVLPAGTTARTIPEGAYSWVEWARGIAVEAAGGGRYDVTVVFRTLAGGGDGSMSATPVRAVTVPVVVDAQGAAGIVDLPSPAPVPAPAESSGVAWEPSPDVPEPVVAAATEQATVLGGTVELIGGTQLASGGWRVVLGVTDPSGVSFPVAVDVAG